MGTKDKISATRNLTLNQQPLIPIQLSNPIQLLNPIQLSNPIQLLDPIQHQPLLTLVMVRTVIMARVLLMKMTKEYASARRDGKETIVIRKCQQQPLKQHQLTRVPTRIV